MKNHGNFECDDGPSWAYSAYSGRTKREFAPEGVQNLCMRPAMGEIARACVTVAASAGVDTLRTMSWFGRIPAARDAAMKEVG